MSHGLEIFDENGKEIFSINSSYFRHLGTHTFAATSSSNQSAIATASFSISGAIPGGAAPFVALSPMFPNGIVGLDGLTVRVSFNLTSTGSGSSRRWHRERTDIIYGFYT